MRKQLLSIAAVLVGLVAQAQQMDLPVTFNVSGINYGLIGFGGAEASTIEVDPTDGSNTVAKVIKSATAELWAGTTISDANGSGLANPIPFTETNTQMTLRVWSPDAGIPVRLKVEDSTNPTISVETEAATTSAGQWETLTFNFSNQAAGTAAINLANSYNKASVFFNFGTTGAVAGEKTYYFDDLQMGQEAQDVQMDLPVTFDVSGVNYGLIGFGGAEASTIEVDPTDGSNTVAKVIKSATAELWAGTTISDANGSGLANPIPFTETNTQMTLRVWSPDAGIPVRLKVEDSTNPTISVETEATTTAAEQWETLTFNFSNQVAGTAAINLANSYNKASVFFNFGTTGAVAGEKTYYFDDLQMGQGGGVSSYTVVFSVDMSNVTDAFTTPEINGTFNTWCGGCAPMSDADGDNVWELAIELAPGTYEYKFAYDSWAGQETLLPGGSCVITTNQFTNRILTVSGNETLPVVCWASCSSCDNPTGPFNITFKVDMNEVTDNFTTPEVNGSFNNWCGGCAPMSDADGDNVWELTISLATDTFEYKFAYDSWAGQESLTPGSFCTSTIDNFTNRSIIVTGDATLDPVCWGSCDPCVVGFVGKDAATNLILAPNPANDVISITLDQSASTPVQVVILNAQGQQVERFEFTGQTTSVSTSNLPEGLYFFHVIGKLSGTKSFVVSH